MLLLNLKKYKAWLLAAGLLLVLGGGFFLAQQLKGSYMVSVVSKAIRLVPIYQVDTPEKKVAISFDASWGAEHTPRILDILDRHQVKTSFFLVNIWLEDYPEMAQEISRRGHEIQLHSATHPHFTHLSPSQMEKELKENYDLIYEITGQSPTLFRPPFGDYNNQVVQTSEALGFQPIQWSIDSLDWKDLSALEIQNRVLKKIGPGDIVLFHNNGKHTAEALEPILTALAEKGLAVVPISELLLKGDWYIDANGWQKSRS